MTQIIKSRKERANFTIEQKLDYAKLMVNENYSNKKIIAISGAGPSAVTRWKKQYLAEINGQTPKSSKAMTPEQQEIQSLKKQPCILYYEAIFVFKIVRPLQSNST
jgi:transposase